MFHKLISIYLEDYKKINRYIVTSISSYFLTVFLMYIFLVFFSHLVSIIIAQVLKTFLIFLMIKYYTFNHHDNFFSQMKLYIFFVILFKSMEGLAIFIFEYWGFMLAINIFIVLLISSMLKYLIFNKIFS